MKIGTLLECSALALASVACGGSDDTETGNGNHPIEEGPCAKDERGETYTQGMSKTGESGVEIVIVDATPAPPKLGDNHWILKITDSSGTPVDGATVEVAPFMVDHKHYTNRASIVEPQGEGEYDVNPVNLQMSGFWSIEVTVTTDSSSDEVAFGFCAD